MKKTLLVTLSLVCLLAPTARCLMVEIPYEQLWERADTVALGTVKGITAHAGERGMIYQIVSLRVERYIKNPVEEDTLFIRTEGGEIGGSGVWVEDQPEFSVGERTLVFLVETDQTHGEQVVYRVYGLFQGKFTVRGDTAHAPGGPYLNISGAEPLLMPEGNVVLAELVIPEDVTVYEVVYGRIGFTNTGGQSASRNVTLTFRGVEGPCEGYVNSTAMRVGVGPGGYKSRELQLNFTTPGVYEAAVDGETAATFTVYEAGYMSELYSFSGLTFDPPEPDVCQSVNVSLRVSTSLEEPSKCFYRFKVTQSEAAGEAMTQLSIPMVSYMVPGEEALQWYVFVPQAEGVYRVTVWYKGVRVLEDTLKVGDRGETSYNVEDDQPRAVSGNPAEALLAGIAVMTLLLRVRGRASPSSVLYSRGRS
ncbi:hypothetical protein JXL21_02460 [Candidatus Bathyarchaeota archaeon]|nr:hypothetical protein [Candidatus Bathyarchaeota archaeon]